MSTFTHQTELLAAAQALAAGVVADRRAIHQHPELMYQEHRTAALVAGRLRELGLDVRTGVGGTGVVGVLHGFGPGKTVLLRADMDALPIQERNDLPFVSAYPGVMHACGHDGHTAMLLGVAKLLAGRRDQFAGAVKFMFQPAEEGGAGAMRMIDDGLLNEPAVDGAFALHVSPGHKTGQVAVTAGPRNASADEFTITIRGKGGHAARPEATVDTIVVAAHLTTMLQTLVSRETAASDQAVVTVGSFVAGAAHNVIPDTVVMKGTVRTYRRRVQRHLERRISELAHGVATAMRATAEVEYRTLYPSVVNHEAEAHLVEHAIRDILGPDAYVKDGARMASEDFSFVLQRVPGALFSLGVRPPDGERPRSVHTPEFDLDEAALPIGVAVMAGVALRFLA